MSKKFGVFNATQARFVAFYDTEVHGERTLRVPPAGWTPPPAPLIPDPTWRMPAEAEPPLIPDPNWAQPEGVDGAVLMEAPLIADPAWTPPPTPLIPDPDFVPPEPPYYDEVPNPDCKIPADAVPIDDDTWRDELGNPGKYHVAGGKVERAPGWAPPAPDYRQLRLQAYPSINEQLDALWHAMDQGLLPKVAGFYDRVTEVKARYPKP